MDEVSHENEEKLENAKEEAAQIILNAEQFKALINEPQVKPSLTDNGLSDDDFFHVTCHVDTNLEN